MHSLECGDPPGRAILPRSFSSIFVDFCPSEGLSGTGVRTRAMMLIYSTNSILGTIDVTNRRLGVIQMRPRTEMAETDQSEVLVQHIAEHQNRLYGYIFSMVGDHARAADVLQETNLVLWRKKQEFRAGEPFLPWAFSIARYQVLAHIRDRGRDRCLLDTELVELIAEETQKQAERFEELRHALRGCLAKLSPHHMEMVQARYFRSTSIDDLARSQRKAAGAVKVALLRIRRQLAACIERKLAENA